MKRLALFVAAALMVVLVLIAAYQPIQPITGKPASSDSASTSELIQSRARIPAHAPDGTPITQLSALAWDHDEQLLYALSDRGTLFHFRVSIQGNRILGIEPVHAEVIASNEPLHTGSRGADTEDMTLLNHDNGRKGDTELFVVTERTPLYIHLHPSGSMIRTMSVPAPLADPGKFQKANQGLESVILHPKHGLLTAPEAPLTDASGDMHTLYGSHLSWMFKRHTPDARLKAMAWLPDGDVLMLERSSSSTPKMKIASLRQVSLNDCAPGQICAVKSEFVLPEEPNNFEGLTHVKDRQFLMVNDHGGKDGHGGVLLLVVLPQSTAQDSLPK
jgi:hypothetical protein